MARKLGAKAAKRREERAAKAQPIDPAGVPDATIKKHVLKCSEYRAAVDKANGEYRAALKAAKSDGVDPGVITWYLRTKKRELQEVDFETKQRNRVALIMKLPIGAQLGLFPDGDTVARKVDSGAIEAGNGSGKAAKKTRSSAKTIAAAKLAGSKAGADGKNMEHDFEDGSPEALAFEAAWKDAQNALARKTFGAEQAAGRA